MSNYTDDRGKWEWQSRYPATARKYIYLEGVYCLFLILVTPILVWIVLSGFLTDYFSWTDNEFRVFSIISLSWLGGTLGGSLFTAKWLVHVVANGLWHRDRHLWRFITPHSAGAVTLAFVTILDSDLVPIVSITEPLSLVGLVGTSVFVGYFSDAVIGQFTDFAEAVFGRVGDDSLTDIVDEDET